MRLRRRLAAAVVAAMMGVSAVFVLGASSAVADPYQDCFDGEWCIYEHVDFGGEQCYWQGNASDYSQFYGWAFGINCNDIMSSYVNNGYGAVSWIRVFKHANYSDRLRIVPPRESGFGDAVETWAGSINDLASSHTWGNP